MPSTRTFETVVSTLRTLTAGLLGLFLLATVVQAQDMHSHERELVRRNHLSVEVGGNGGIYTLNYERQLTPLFAARVGIEYYPAIESRSRDTDKAFLAPVMVSFVPELARLWGAPLSAEVGAGALLIYTSGTETVYASREDLYAGRGIVQDFRDFGASPTALAALRLYVMDERLAFRAGVAVLPNRSEWQSGEILLWPLLSVGYRF